MIINHNIAALNTYRQLSGVNTASSRSLEKLSSGLRINRAGDDAAGLAISEKMRGQIRGLEQATRNAQDGISLIQTAEGALNEIQSILQRMRELAVQSANDTNTPEDRAEIQKEVDQLAQELTRIANDTEFNTQKLLNGGIQEGNIDALTFQIGANTNQNMSLEISAMDAYSLGVARDTDATQASGELAAGVTISAVAGGDYDGTAGNIKVVVEVSSNATVGAAFSDGTLTITLDPAGTMDAAAITAALQDSGLADD
ncbi:MAG: flagellin, partial [Firmicutes bacterium]|nr:flagellin [Bacillota bacterium]